MTTMTAFTSLFVFFIVFLKSQNSFAAPISDQTPLSAPVSDPKCQTELNLEKNTIQELLRVTSFASEEDAHFEESVGCLWEKEGLVSEDGIINLDNFRDAMVKEFRKEFLLYEAQNRAEDVAYYCRQVRGSNAGEASIKMIKCLAKWKTQEFVNYERKESY